MKFCPLLIDEIINRENKKIRLQWMMKLWDLLFMNNILLPACHNKASNKEKRNLFSLWFSRRVDGCPSAQQLDSHTHAHKQLDVAQCSLYCWPLCSSTGAGAHSACVQGHLSSRDGWMSASCSIYLFWSPSSSCRFKNGDFNVTVWLNSS